jgi:hypothetical protein
LLQRPLARNRALNVSGSEGGHTNKQFINARRLSRKGNYH